MSTLPTFPILSENRVFSTSQVKKGDRVCYEPYPGCPREELENGLVKYIPVAPEGYTNLHLFVVYKCRGDWENFENYTSARTHIGQLYYGWAE